MKVGASWWLEANNSVLSHQLAVSRFRVLAFSCLRILKGVARKGSSLSSHFPVFERVVGGRRGFSYFRSSVFSTGFVEEEAGWVDRLTSNPYLVLYMRANGLPALSDRGYHRTSFDDFSSDHLRH